MRGSGATADGTPDGVKAAGHGAGLSLPLGADGLDARTVLYVGGYPHLAPHLRQRVELLNGRLLHHHGGVEARIGALPGLVAQADLVVCPLACLSHDAFLRIKQLCMRQGKRFIVLRSASLSSFTLCLDQIAHALADDRGLARKLFPPACAAASSDVSAIECGRSTDRYADQR